MNVLFLSLIDAIIALAAVYGLFTFYHHLHDLSDK